MTAALQHTKSESFHVSIPVDLTGERCVTIAATDELSVKLLHELAKSLASECHPGIPDDCKVFLQCDPEIKGMCRSRRGDSITIQYSPAFVHDNREAFLLRECVYAAIAFESFFNQKGITLFHGTFLEENAEEGILLFGESGIGKSTTRQRWLNEGGASIADDALLLMAHDGQFYMRPLPTWSAWLSDGNKRIYPIAQNLRVRALYWLSRDPAKQCIVPAEPARYHCQLLSALLIHSYGPRQTFTTEETMSFGNRSWDFIQLLEKVFPVMEFRAHLDWPLKETFYSGGCR